MSDAPEKPIFKLYGDAAKVNIADDKFSLDSIAESVAALLMSRIAADGYTLGIEGEWGSGKTTLTNFIIEHIEKQQSLDHKLLRFDPWLIGKRDQLIREFFTGLLAKIAELRSDPVLAKKIQAENPGLLDSLVAQIEQYRDMLDKGASVIVTAAPFDPSLHLGGVALALKILGWLAKAITTVWKVKPVTLEGLRTDIKANLNALAKLSPNTRFTVIIDDMDRLDPEESIEILRLIRAVADFPLVTYLVCFDRTYLAKQIVQTIKVGDGHEYLEKIFQNIISLPPQEPFALRRFASQTLAERFPAEFSNGDSADRSPSERSAMFFDHWVGHFVLTPRDAIRFCEAVTFGWPYLEGRADFIDYAWLQLIKLKCPKLYRWTREYVVNLGSFRDGGRPGDQEATTAAASLIDIMKEVGWPNDRDYPGLTYFIPGVKNYVDQSEPKVYDVEKSELAEFELARRLGSPSHWRMYFSFDSPSYALDDDILGQFRTAAAENVAKGIEIIRGLMHRAHPRPAHYLDIFLERLFDIKDRLEPKEQIGMARIFAEVMDEVTQNPQGSFRVLGPWRRAETILGPAVGPQFAKICTSGAAINWLSDVMRTQGFVSGRADPKRSRPDEQWLTLEQLDASLTAILKRLQEMGIAKMLQSPQPLTMFYCWQQLGEAETLRIAIEHFVESDEGFIRFLDGLRGWVASSSKGSYRALQTRNVSSFLDAPVTHKRLQALIKGSSSLTPDMKALALEINENWEVREDGVDI